LRTRVQAGEAGSLIYVAAPYLDDGYVDDAITLLDRAFTLEPACARLVMELPRLAKHRNVPAFDALLTKFHQ